MAEGVEDALQVESQPPRENGDDTATKLEVQDDSKVNGALAVKEEEDLDDTPNDGRPAKRRKLDVSSQLRGTSRAVSPPWRQVAADGPTSFLDSGKRRSARTNIVPLELQPPSSKRRTRAANHQAVRDIKGRHSKGGQGLVKSSPIPTKATPKRPYNRLSGMQTKQSSAGALRSTEPTRALRNASMATPVKSSGKKPIKTPSKAPTKAPTRIPVSQRWAMEISPVKTELDSPPLTPIDGKPRRRAAAPRTNLLGDTKPVKRRVATARESKPERAASVGTPEENDGSDSLDELSSSLFDDEDFEIDPNITPQRLNLKVKLPELIPQHPLNIPRKSHHPTFRDWIQQADPFEGGDPRLSDDQVRREARSRMRILQASEPGGILSGVSSLDVPENEEEPSRQYFHHDHLLAHALDMQRRMEREKAKHMRWAKKISQAVIDYWKELQPKTDEDLRREKEDIMEVTALAVRRQCVADLAFKWDMLRAELVKQRHARWEQEQEVLEKERLNKVLEQSTQLLDARKRRDSDVESTDDGSRTDVSSEGDNSSAESDAESNMSIDSSEHEDESEGEVNDDQDLSPDELRRKYQTSIQESPDRIGEGTPATEVTEPIASAAKEESTGNAVSEVGQDQVTESEHNERPPESATLAAMLDEDNNSLLDETDESVDMDDDMGDTESDSDEDDDEEASSSEAESNGRAGLLGLFSKKELAEAAGSEDDSQGAALEKDTSQAPESAETKADDASTGQAIPEASQVQTPSASNSDITSMGVPKNAELLRSKSSATLDEAHGQHMDTVPGKPQSTSAEDMEVDRASLPATPVSSKPLKTAVPSLLRGTLREYQHFGLDWLAGLYANGTNGILADEMGLGKTIQTIVLLAHLAVEHEVWGPHLIVVPTSVMLNWEMEFKKFLPGFKVMTYYGTQEERKQKRKGWLDDDKWNVVISSYQLVLQDQISFKKRGWHYLVLDEAHNIKNFRSQRWQTLLTFRTAARLLLTGTPLQNNLTELWSLMFFLMPSDSTESGIAGFADLQSFTNWFKKPVDQILEQGRDTMDAEAQELVRRLHEVLRPYLLRRLKADVEKQMPAKYEHVVYCKLSKRQRYLYDGFMSRASTRETLSGGNYLSIINCLMQLRKVCNHPDLFETRPIVTSFAMSRSAVADFEIKELFLRRKLLQDEDDRRVNLDVVDLLPGSNGPISALETIQPARLGGIAKMRQIVARHSSSINKEIKYDGSSVEGTLSWMENDQRIAARDDLHHRVYLTSLRSQRRPLISHSLVDKLRFDLRPVSVRARPQRRVEQLEWLEDISPVMDDLVVNLPRRFESLQTTIEKYSFVTPAVVAQELPTFALTHAGKATMRQVARSFPEDHFHESRMRLSVAFPDKRLLQYDCGKLQRLDTLLRKLQAGGHRALIFTQMTKVLDILEQFLNIHGHRYLRLDGSTKIEQRQILTDRFNNDPKILAFILSSRSGGLGINLTGADTVIFYDLDWNPAMDKQCQDRCHRIGQTRDVHIYRFVSEYTIEANILRKANQKRLLDDVIIQGGEFTTDFFHRPNPRDVYTDDAMHEADAEASAAMDRILGAGSGNDKLSTRILEQAEDKEDAQAAKVAEKEVQHADDADFSERPGPLSGKFASGTQTPALKEATTPKPLSSYDFDAPEYLRGSVQPRTEMALDIFTEKQPIGVDLHMVEHLEWELRDVPIGPPPGHEKAKKKGKDHKVVRKR